MYYARWATKEEMKNYLHPLVIGEKSNQTGLPILYEENKVYVENKSTNTLVIGGNRSEKNNGIFLPFIKLAMQAGESFLINDSYQEIYKNISYALEKENYDIITLDLEDFTYGNTWNPLLFPYTLYQKGDKDKAVRMLDELGYYMFGEPHNNQDPFWIHSATDYFIGLTLFLFEHAQEEEIHLQSIYHLANQMFQKNEEGQIYYQQILQNLDKKSLIYMHLSGTLLAPSDTKGSILSVFKQKYRKYVTHTKLNQILSQTDFSMENIGTKKTAIFIFGGNSEYSEILLPILMNQVSVGLNLYNKEEKTMHVFLDDFENLFPIKNFNKLLNQAPATQMRFIVGIQSYLTLKNLYGKEMAEMVKMGFDTILYLLSQDMETLQEISAYCGNCLNASNTVEPLIRVEELKTLPLYEAIVLIPRMMPYKTTLLPDSEIPWPFQNQTKPLAKISDTNITTFELEKLLEK